MFLFADLHNSSFPGYDVPFGPIPTAVDLCSALEAALPANVSSILPFADSEPFPLRWGELIPLSFLLQGPGDVLPPLVVLSQPLRRYNDSVAMIPELLGAGASMLPLLDACPQRVLVVASADLAHTHANPTGVEPYGTSPAAQPFDDAVGRWVATGDASALVQEAALYAQDALSCGYTGTCVLLV